MLTPCESDLERIGKKERWCEFWWASSLGSGPGEAAFLNHTESFGHTVCGKPGRVWEIRPGWHLTRCGLLTVRPALCLPAPSLRGAKMPRGALRGAGAFAWHELELQPWGSSWAWLFLFNSLCWMPLHENDLILWWPDVPVCLGLSCSYLMDSWDCSHGSPSPRKCRRL